MLIWTHAGWHPSLAFTSQLLSEAGHLVHILARSPLVNRSFTEGAQFGKNAQLQQVGRSDWYTKGRQDYFSYLAEALRLTRRFRPDVIIGYDLHGFVAAYLAHLRCPSSKLVYHNFDLAPSTGISPFTRMLKRLEILGAQKADVTIFSSAVRADLFSREAALKRKPLVVMNCQRLHQLHQPTGELQTLLSQTGRKFDRLVVRLGMIGPHHGIEATIRSICDWKGNWGLILAGAPIESYMEEIKQLVMELRLDDQVIFLPSVSFSLWYECLYNANLGIALYEPVGTNNMSMAGAGNKLNLYLKAGIPSIVPTIPDFVAMTDRYKIGEVADPTDPASIAGAINAVLLDSRKYTTYSENARHAFETEFNFEKQFEPVLRLLHLSNSDVVKATTHRTIQCNDTRRLSNS